RRAARSSSRTCAGSRDRAAGRGSSSRRGRPWPRAGTARPLPRRPAHGRSVPLDGEPLDLLRKHEPGANIEPARTYEALQERDSPVGRWIVGERLAQLEDVLVDARGRLHEAAAVLEQVLEVELALLSRGHLPGLDREYGLADDPRPDLRAG